MVLNCPAGPLVSFNAPALVRYHLNPAAMLGRIANVHPWLTPRWTFPVGIPGPARCVLRGLFLLFEELIVMPDNAQGHFRGRVSKCDLRIPWGPIFWPYFLARLTPLRRRRTLEGVRPAPMDGHGFLERPHQGPTSGAATRRSPVSIQQRGALISFACKQIARAAIRQGL